MITQMEQEYYATEKQTIEMKPIETKGLILDIGGGGEGIIGRLNGRNVVAVDTRIEELEETKNDSLKVVMDATDLKFLPSSFDVATSFFSMMYIKNDKHRQVFQEIHKVLKRHGTFHIWDVRIPPKHVDKPIFAVFLEILLPNEKAKTGYGVSWEHKEQDIEYFNKLAEKADFKITDEWTKDEIFYLKLIKN
jgi:ubiquinone/menaquinone biosynthesis C-methylase UbiE